MNDFFKRLSWRLTGGIVTIALGAFAAAQAQKQTFDDSQNLIGEQSVQPMEASEWANTLPIPIQSGPEQSGNDRDPPNDGPSTRPASFAMEMPRSGNEPPGPLPEPNDRTATALIAQVGHQEEIAPNALPSEASAPTDAGPSMTMPAVGMPAMGMPEVQFDLPPDGAMNQPNASPGMHYSFEPPMESDGGLAGDLAIEPATAQPEMAMPAMSMPTMSMPAMVMPAMVMPNGQPETAPEPPSVVASRSENHQADGPATNSLREAPAPRFDQAANLEPYPSDQSFNPPAFDQSELMDEPQPSYDATYDRPAQAGQNDTATYDERSVAAVLPSLPAPSPMASPQYETSQANDLRHDTAYGQRSPYGEPSSYGESSPYGESSRTNPLGLPQSRGGMPPAKLAGHQKTGLPINGGNDPIAIGMPGDRRLEGVQSPSVVIHKRAPAEVKVGQPATFVIQVRNVGTAEALGVQVHDRIPAGMQLVDVMPQPEMQGDMMIWQLGSMPVGDERSITMQLIPREEGELGSVARVTFEAAASVRTRSTRPELKITQRAPQQVLIGQQLEIELEIANIGTGEATGVVLQEDVPEGLDHPQGRQLDNALGNLRPGETRTEVLRLRAVQPGMIQNVVHLIAEDAQEVSHTVDVEIVAPSLDVQLAGPSRRFLERQATYMVNIQNAGTAPATNVEVVAFLDPGFTFVSTENNGHYDPNRHAVLWSIVSLPPGDSGSVPLTLLPIEEGEQAIRLEAVADLNTRAQNESTVSVQSQAELSFAIVDTADPIEIGTETTYEIRVKNSGSRGDTNVQVRMIVPPGLELLQSDSDVQTDGRGGVMFPPQKSLAAGGDLTYRIRVKGIQPDTHIVKAIVTSDQARVPVTKEESTMVYADR